MFTEKERAKWRERVARWRNGELVYDAGRIVEKSDNTSVNKIENRTYIPKDINIPILDKQEYRDRMYRTVAPTGYTKLNAMLFVKNRNRALSQYDDPNTEGVYGLYTNQDSVIADYSQTVGPSAPKYRVLSNAEKHQLDPIEEWPEGFSLGKYAVKDILLRSKYKQGAYEFIHPYDTNPFFVKNNLQDPPKWRHNHTLGSFKTGAGIDKNGVYDWYEDRWDINLAKGVSSNDDAGFTKLFVPFSSFDDVVPFGNPVKIYGRKYRQ